MSIPSSTPHADRVASSTVYKPDDPDFAADFVEFSNSWSRRQVDDVWQASGDDDGPLLDALRPKIVALRLTCADAEPITDSADLTPERTEQMDVRLYAWFAGAWVAHLGALADLGNALRRQLFVTSDSTSSNGSETTPPQKPTPASSRSRSRRSRKS